ncbi:hypothetical protein RFI_12363, partial [Reticulomyxa filosa]
MDNLKEELQTSYDELKQVDEDKNRHTNRHDFGKSRSESTLYGGWNPRLETLAKYIASLSSEERADLSKMDLSAERVIERLGLKLEETTEQRNQATEMMRTLAKENESLKMENDEVKSAVRLRDEEIKLLEKDNTLMGELLEEEKAKYETELQKMDKMRHEMMEREEELELRLKEQEDLEREKRTSQNVVDTLEDEELNKLSTETEKRLYLQLQEEKKRAQQLKQQMDIALTRLENETKTEEELQQLKEYCMKLEQDHATELEEANEINTSVQSEIVKLTHKTVCLEQDKLELTKHLENKLNEITMLRKNLERFTKRRIVVVERNGDKEEGEGEEDDNDDDDDDDDDRHHSNAIADEIYNTQKRALLDMVAPDDEQFDNVPVENQPIPIPIPIPVPSLIVSETDANKIKPNPPDVLKEYPKVAVESEELMKKVQLQPFYNYYELMTQIMEAENSKLKRPKHDTPSAHHTSFFSKMKHKN